MNKNLPDPNLMSDMFDCSHGQLAFYSRNLFHCYQMLKGTRAKLANALFGLITSGVHIREVIKEGDKVHKKGSLWSNPMLFDEVMSACVTTAKLGSFRSNYQRYMNELIESNIFYRFGCKGLYAYTYERNVCSWGCFCKGVPYIYPCTIQKLIGSRIDLFNLFWTISKTYHSESVITVDTASFEFSIFIDGLLDKLPPPAKNKCRRFDHREDANAYLIEIKEVLDSMHQFEGFSRFSTFDMSRLPALVAESYHVKAGVTNDLSEIIPREEGGLAPERKPIKRKSKHSMHSIDVAIVSEMVNASSKAVSSLDPEHNYKHFLSLLERSIKRVKGLPDDPQLVISRNLNQERLEFDALADKMKALDVFRKSFIIEWIDWASVQWFADRDIGNRTVLIRDLSRTLNRFIKSREKEKCESLYSSIWEDLRKQYDGVRPIENLCAKYGYIIPFTFLWAKYGKKEANLVYEDMLHRLEIMDEPVRRKIMIKMTRKTFVGSNEAGYLTESYMIDRINTFFEKNKADDQFLGLTFATYQDTAIKAFWRKAQYADGRTRKRRSADSD